MKKNKLAIYALLSLATLVIFLMIINRPIVQSFTHGHYNITEHDDRVTASRCDHLMDPPGADPYNAFTSCGINAMYNDEDDAYTDVTYIYVRGFGGPTMWPHDWTCNGGSMTCMYQANWTYSYYYDSNQPTWSYGYAWPGYYQRYDKYTYATNAYTVGARCSSYFYNYTDTNQYVYISSPISAWDMYAGDVNEKDETF